MSPRQTTAVVVAHPGHEVRIHGWLERECPRVHVLTDGSGREGRSRLDSAASYLKFLGASAGQLFGPMTDLEVYRVLLARDFQPFVRMADELAESFAAEGVGRVVGDASEGYNTMHDIGRLITNAAVEAVRRGGGHLENYDFPVVNRPDHCPERLRGKSLWLRLDDECFGRKLAAAFEFYPELAAETRDALQSRGRDAAASYFELHEDEQAATALRGLEMFRVECLRPVEGGAAPFETERPFYELQGEMRVAGGHYPEVIRYREHLVPLADALLENVERKS